MPQVVTGLSYIAVCDPVDEAGPTLSDPACFNIAIY